MQATNHVVSAQWASRPNDQRFLDVASLGRKVRARRQSSEVLDVALDCMQVRPMTESADADIELVDSRGQHYGQLTHYSFGQLCQRAHAPAGFLRELPPMLACMNLQYKLEAAERRANDEGNDAKILTRRNGSLDIAAVNSGTYGRIWDADVVGAVETYVDLDEWRVPSSSYSGTDPLRVTTLYASDRDIFLFLVNETAEVSASGESLKRGFYVWNSEVGSATFGVAMMLYDRVCDNRIIWGVRDFREVKIRHTSGGPMRFVQTATPQLEAYVRSSPALVEGTIRRAKDKVLGKSQADVLSWMKQRGFTQPQARAAYEAAENDPRGYNPRSVWGLVQGLTESAHELKHTDERVALERKAGALLDLVSE